MTEAVPCVVAPYARFQEYQDRRRRTGADPIARSRPQAVGADAVSVPAAAAAPRRASTRSPESRETAP